MHHQQVIYDIVFVPCFLNVAHSRKAGVISDTPGRFLFLQPRCWFHTQ